MDETFGRGAKDRSFNSLNSFPHALCPRLGPEPAVPISFADPGQFWDARQTRRGHTSRRACSTSPRLVG